MALFWMLGSVSESESSEPSMSIALLFSPLSPHCPGIFTAWSVMFVGYYYHNMPTPIGALVNCGYTVVNTLTFLWSAATNVWATAMIAYKAWYVLLIQQFPWNVAQSTYHCLDRQQRKEFISKSENLSAGHADIAPSAQGVHLCAILAIPCKIWAGLHANRYIRHGGLLVHGHRTAQ